MALVVMRLCFGDLLVRHLHVVIGLQNIIGYRSIGIGFVHVSSSGDEMGESDELAAALVLR